MRNSTRPAVRADEQRPFVVPPARTTMKAARSPHTNAALNSGVPLGTDLPTIYQRTALYPAHASDRLCSTKAKLSPAFSANVYDRAAARSPINFSRTSR